MVFSMKLNVTSPNIQLFINFLQSHAVGTFYRLSLLTYLFHWNVKTNSRVKHIENPKYLSFMTQHIFLLIFKGQVLIHICFNLILFQTEPTFRVKFTCEACWKAKAPQPSLSETFYFGPWQLAEKKICQLVFVPAVLVFKRGKPPFVVIVQ